MFKWWDPTQIKKVSDICLIAPTEQLAAQADKIILKQKMDNIEIFAVGLGRNAIIDCARELYERGAKVIISRKGCAQIIEETKTFDVPVVNLNNSIMDYLIMLKKCDFQTGGLVAFFSYGPLSHEIVEICDLLGFQARNYVFGSFEDCHACVQKALADGAVMSIGGAWTAPVAREAGLEHVVVENSEESILSACMTAQQLLEVELKEAAKQRTLQAQMETYQAVLEFTHDAIMSIDDQGRVQVLNPVAERIMGVRAAEAIGRNIEEVLPNTMLPEVLRSGEPQLNQIMQIHKTLANTNRIPIVVNGETRGVVATFQDIKQLQTTEQKIRLKLHERGLVAKYTFSDILGSSGAIRDTVRRARSYAASHASVLICGETGTGKEMFAQSIHNASERCNGPFVAVNCTAVAANLLESELFGYEAGAFTGAAKNGKEGLFELAHGGTIFLDEIGEISKETQVELLRVLQEKEIRRVGGSRLIPVDVRIISATNLDLLQEIAQNRFREDLYYRLNVLNLEVPPLREREDDVKLIGERLLRRLGGESPDIRNQYLRLLHRMQGYPWYGNIRELQNFTERVYILLQNGADADSVVSEMTHRKPNANQMQKLVESEERNRVKAALKEHDRVEDAAASLGYSRQTLWRKMKKYGISR